MCHLLSSVCVCKLSLSCFNTCRLYLCISHVSCLWCLVYVTCVCVCSPLCHEEVATAQRPRWLQLRGQRLPQSQPVCGGDWRRASGTTSIPQDIVTHTSSVFCLFLLLHMHIWPPCQRQPTASHCSLVYCIAYLLQAEKRETNDDQDDIESNLLLPAGVTLRWATLSLKVYRAEDIPQSKMTHQWQAPKISSSSLEIRGSVVAATRGKLWWNLPLPFSTSGWCVCAVNKRHVWRRGEQEEPGGSFLGGSLRWQKGSQNKNNFCSRMQMHPIAKQKWPVMLVRLQLCTQIIEKNANPEWNQLLNLQVKVRTSQEQKWCYYFVL